ncbi:MAG: hypothetical protein Kow00106_06190 [Anaerolineae bacterium]
MRRRLVVLLGILLSLWPATVHGGSPAARVDDQLLAALNAWRQDERQLWPLQPNEQLTALARQQAQYLLSLPDIPDDVHRGPGGETPQDRARAAGWPVYGRPEQIAIGEIGKVGPSVEDAIGFWQTSDIHHRTVMNPAYREVGIAALPHRYGYLFIVVFGARPNVLPAQVDPVHGLLYLSDERFSGAARAGDWLYRAQEVRLFDEEGHPLTDWMAWQPTLPLPDEPGDLLVIVYRTASAETLDVIHLERDRVFLPGAMDSVPAEVMVAPSATATRAPTPLAPSVTTPTPRPVTATPALVPDVTVTPDTRPDVLLVYDARSLALINVSGRALDLTALVIAGAADSLPLTRWQTPWLSGSLTAFTAGDCLQVWAWTEAGDLPLPAGCRYRRGVINVAPEGRFWAESDFTLRAGQTVLATCLADGGECAARLPR